MVGVYVTAKLVAGGYLTHEMSIADAYAIRDRSESWKRGQKGPWKTDEGEMIKKTVVKQASKYWPKSNPRMAKAIDVLNTESGEGIVFEHGQPAAAAPTAEEGFYLEADFLKNFPKWEEAIKAGKRTPQQIIERVISKAPLTETQSQKILSIGSNAA